nr:hypothetical protein [Tanacetum cinerariifolium]
MRYEHLSITPETEYDEVTESNAKNLLPIPYSIPTTMIFQVMTKVLWILNTLTHQFLIQQLLVQRKRMLFNEKRRGREEVDLFLSDDSIPPGIENVADDPEGDVRFLEELLIDDSILSHESFDFNFKDNPLISRPPPEPHDDNFDLELEVISAVIEDIDEPDEHFNPGGEIFVSINNKDVDYFPFMLVIQIFLPYLILPEISPLLLSAESEDTIFDPGIFD